MVFQERHNFYTFDLITSDKEEFLHNLGMPN